MVSSHAPAEPPWTDRQFSAVSALCDTGQSKSVSALEVLPPPQPPPQPPPPPVANPSMSGIAELPLDPLEMAQAQHAQAVLDFLAPVPASAKASSLS